MTFLSQISFCWLLRIMMLTKLPCLSICAILLLSYPSASFLSPHISRESINVLQMSNDVECKKSTEQFTTQLENESSLFNRRSFIISGATLSILSLTSNVNNARAEEEDSPVATFALRRTGGVLPSPVNLPPKKLGIFSRFSEGFLYSDDASRTPGKDITASFYFPADWLQLDR